MRRMLLLVGVGCAEGETVSDSGSPPTTPPDPEVCGLTEPLTVDEGLPASVWAGAGGVDGGDIVFEVSAGVDPARIFTEGFGGGFAWLSVDTFDFTVDPVAWLSVNEPYGACDVGDGVLDCTIDPGHELAGTKRFTFTADCLWLDQVFTSGATTEESHFELAPR